MLSNVEIRKMQNSGINLIQSDDGSPLDIETKLLQPASIDLTIGDIICPPLKNDRKQRPYKACDGIHNLKPGETALVVTVEKLSLTGDIGGLMFPKNGDFATRGILITNFGHVDPGYRGHLSFTVINFGATSFPLIKGEKITSLTLFKLNETSDPNWSDSKKEKDKMSDKGRAKVLSPDFLNIEKRINQIIEANVKDEVARQNFRRDFTGPLIGILLGAFIGFAALIMPMYLSLDNKIHSITLNDGN